VCSRHRHDTTQLDSLLANLSRLVKTVGQLNCVHTADATQLDSRAVGVYWSLCPIDVRSTASYSSPGHSCFRDTVVVTSWPGVGSPWYYTPCDTAVPNFKRKVKGTVGNATPKFVGGPNASFHLLSTSPLPFLPLSLPSSPLHPLPLEVYRPFKYS